MESLFMDHVPDAWTKLAYPSLLGLAAWFSDLCLRLTELENWSGDFNVSFIYVYFMVQCAKMYECIPTYLYFRAQVKELEFA